MHGDVSRRLAMTLRPARATAWPSHVGLVLDKPAACFAGWRAAKVRHRYRDALPRHVAPDELSQVAC